MSRVNLLRKYIREILQEAKEDIEDSKDPTDWVQDAFNEPESWGTENPYSAMIQAAKKIGLEELGIGSSRFVFSMSNGKVLKIARNSKGVEQNKLEFAAGKDPHVHYLLASVYDSSPDYAWLVAEAVDPLDDLDFKVAESVTGVPWAEVRSVLGLADKSEAAATISQVTKKIDSKSSGTKGQSSSSGCLTGSAFLESLGEFLERYRDMLPGDIVKLSSWGINKKGCLVLLDYGITRKKFEELYK